MKTVCITGGTAGIGKATALAFAKKGYAVAVCGRNEQKLQAAAEEFEHIGTPFLPFCADVSLPAQLESFATAAMQAFGHIDVWINNAGGSIPRKFFYEYSETEFQSLIDANIKSVFFGSAVAARYMKGRGGVILQTSSFTSMIPSCGAALYGATKAAIDNLTKTMAAELAPDAIRVLSVQPAYVLTEMAATNIRNNKDALLAAIPLKRLATPEDMAGVFVFLASDVASYMTGISIPVTGGKMAVQNPGFAYEHQGER